jgi:hypothetical protein
MSSVDIILQAFDSSFVLSSQAILPDLSYVLDTSADIALTQEVSKDVLSEVFYFRTDEDITSLPSDSSHVQYYVDKSKLTGGQATLNPFNGTVVRGRYVASDHLGKDFLRDMAQHLFNTHYGVDLFTNEDAVIADISTKSTAVANDLYNAKMGAVNIDNNSLQGPDASGWYFKKDDTSNTNLTREILNQLLTSSPGRFADKTSIRKYTDLSGLYGVPFLPDDTISYKLTVTANAGQHTTVNTGAAALGPRTYTVILKAIA